MNSAITLRTPATRRLGLAHSTVKHHLANARSKVGAVTTAQLVWILAPRLPEPGGVAQNGRGTFTKSMSPSLALAGPRRQVLQDRGHVGLADVIGLVVERKLPTISDAVAIVERIARTWTAEA